MPIYSYHCTKCNKTKEKIKSVNDRNTVPKCKKDDCLMKLEIFTSALKSQGLGTNLNTLTQTNQRINNEAKKY